MRPATRLIHALTGKPPVEGANARLFTDENAICAVCGQEETKTAPADRVLGQNFTDRSMFSHPESDRACWACTAICSGTPPRTFRQWTIIATPGHDLPESQEKAAAWIGQHRGVCLTSKANTEPIIDTLLDPPDTDWVVSVAESGQKHVAPYAVINQGCQGTIRFEAVNVTYDRNTFRNVFFHALALRRLGVPADAVMQGIPKYLKTRVDLTTWKQHADQLKPHQTSPLLALALWTITKRIIENASKYSDA